MDNKSLGWFLMSTLLMLMIPPARSNSSTPCGVPLPVVSAKPEMTYFGTGNGGHMGIRLTQAPEEYGFGFTLYSAAWPLLEGTMPNYQSGLLGTWIYPSYTNPAPKNVYNSMEGGLGWWQDTRFLTLSPKFSMGGVSGDFGTVANSPNWAGSPPRSRKMGIAQLSPRLLVPPDGITLQKEMSGELFGYGYMALPLTKAHDEIGGSSNPTGNHSWTLFLNTSNFKGPVAFFTPYFWSHVSEKNPSMKCQGLDSRPAHNTGAAMEVGATPRFLSTDKSGAVYSRVPAMRFPVDERNQTVLVNNVTRYSRRALWDECEAWFSGGIPAPGKFAEQGALPAGARSLFEGLKQSSAGNNEIRMPVTGIERSAVFTNLDVSTWGFQWKEGPLPRWNTDTRMGTFPEYYRSSGNAWVAVSESEVPDETGLKTVLFPYGPRKNPEPYIAPEEAMSYWRKPGPKTEPFKAVLNDGSTVTYSWYRFVDQPTLQNAGLSDEEREHLQSVVEKLHRAWTINKEYLPPPSRGKLAALDPALIVNPPKGLEVGYVPVVTRQEATMTPATR